VEEKNTASSHDPSRNLRGLLRLAQRIIIHMDLDYFYAQCEETANPSIRGKPVVVCVYSGRTTESGVVSTSNYEARKYGVKAGIPITRAKRLLESTGAIFLPMNHALYESVSERIMDIVESHGDAFEKAGIDEAYLDVSEASNGNYDAARSIGASLKQLIFSEEHITCSIGIAPNKLLAKIASDSAKPDGLTLVNPRQIRQFLSGPVNRIPGIGKKVEERLGHLEVRTIDELARLNPIILHETFGKSLGTYLSRAARGEDDEPVRDRLLPTQLSRIGTLKVNTRDFHIIRPILMNLTESVTEKLNEKDMSCKSVSIIAILSDLTIHTKSTTLESATTDSPLILEASERLMRQFLDSMPQAVLRRVGVKLSGLSKLSGQTTIRSFVST